MAEEAPRGDHGPSKRRRMENETSENPQLSSLDKTDLAPSEDSQSLCNTELLDRVLNEITQEIMNLLSKYATIISERAARDASYVQELDRILEEAKDLESQLIKKKENLKQRFTDLANSLQG